MSRLQEIVVSQGHYKTIENNFGFELMIFNGTVKGKTGYFIGVGKNIYGPFQKVIREIKTKDDVCYFSCMIDPLTAVFVHVDSNGFGEDGRHYYAENIRTLSKIDGSKDTENVEKIGKKGRYTIYRTATGKIFAELAGCKLKKLENYKLYDSYIELYIDNLLTNNDNSFYDVGAEFSAYSPEIFRKLWVVVKKRGDESLDDDGIHRRNSTLDEAKRTAQIINILKSKFSINNLYAVKDCKVRSLNSDRIVDIKKFEAIDLDSFMQINIDGDMWFSTTNLNKELYNSFATINDGEFVISLDDKMYILRDNKLIDMSHRYLLRSEAYDLIVKKAEKLRAKKQKELFGRVKKITDNLTREELDYLDFFCLQYNNSYMAYELMPKIACADYTKDYSVNDLNRQMMAQTINGSYDQMLFFKRWYALLNTKTEFVANAKRFINQLKVEYPEEAKSILCRRRKLLGHLQNCLPVRDCASCYFSGKSLEQLEEKKARLVSVTNK